MLGGQERSRGVPAEAQAEAHDADAAETPRKPKESTVMLLTHLDAGPLTATVHDVKPRKPKKRKRLVSRAVLEMLAKASAELELAQQQAEDGTDPFLPKIMMPPELKQKKAEERLRDRKGRSGWGILGVLRKLRDKAKPHEKVTTIIVDGKVVKVHNENSSSEDSSDEERPRQGTGGAAGDGSGAPSTQPTKKKKKKKPLLWRELLKPKKKDAGPQPDGLPAAAEPSAVMVESSMVTTEPISTDVSPTPTQEASSPTPHARSPSPGLTLSVHKAAFTARSPSMRRAPSMGRTISPTANLTLVRQPSIHEKPIPSVSPQPPQVPSLRSKIDHTPAAPSTRTALSRRRESHTSGGTPHMVTVPVHTVELSFGSVGVLNVGAHQQPSTQPSMQLSTRSSHYSDDASLRDSVRLSGSLHLTPRSTHEEGLEEGGEVDGPLGSSRARHASGSLPSSRHHSRGPSRNTSRLGQAAFGVQPPLAPQQEEEEGEEQEEEEEEEEGAEFDAIGRLMLGSGPSSRMELIGCLLLQLELMATELYEGDLGAPSRPGTPLPEYAVGLGDDQLMAVIGEDSTWVDGDESGAWDEEDGGSSDELGLESGSEDCLLRRVQEEFEEGGDEELVDEEERQRRSALGDEGMESDEGAGSQSARTTHRSRNTSLAPSRLPSRRVPAEGLSPGVALTAHAAAFALLEEELAARRVADAAAAVAEQAAHMDKWKRPATFQQPAMPPLDSSQGWMLGDQRPSHSPRDHPAASPRSGAGTPRGQAAAPPTPYAKQARGEPTLHVGLSTGYADANAQGGAAAAPSTRPPRSPRFQHHPHHHSQGPHSHQQHHRPVPLYTTATHTPGRVHTLGEASAQEVTPLTDGAEAPQGHTQGPIVGHAVSMPSSPAYQHLLSQGGQGLQMPYSLGATHNVPQQHAEMDRLNTAPAAMQRPHSVWDVVRPSSVAGLSATLQGGLGRTKQSGAAHAVQLRSSCAIYKGPRPGVPAQQAVLPALEAMIRLQQQLAPPVPQQLHRLTADTHALLPVLLRSRSGEGAAPTERRLPHSSAHSASLEHHPSRGSTPTPVSGHGRPTTSPVFNSFSVGGPPPPSWQPSSTQQQQQQQQGMGVYRAGTRSSYAGPGYDKHHVQALLEMPPGCPPSVAATLRRKLGLEYGGKHT